MNGADLFQWLQGRRSIRRFAERPIDRDVLDRVVTAATTAPSSTNRQPWRFAVVTAAALRASIAAAVQERSSAMKAVIAQGHHGDEFGSYGDFFFEPLAGAAAIVVPQYRDYPDQIAQFISSGGGDPAAFQTPSAMQMELCGVSAAVMLLLLQARAEGLGACWMAGPMVAQNDIENLLRIERPFRMVGAVALGYPAEQPTPTRRRPVGRVVTWFEDEDGTTSS